MTIAARKLREEIIERLSDVRMGTMLDKSFVILSKIERAKRHIEDLHLSLEKFWDTGPYVVRFEDDASLRERSYFLVSVWDVPFEVVAIVGDALHNIRSALDHLVYQLILTAGKNPTRSAAFPIADSAVEYMNPFFRRKIELVGKGATAAIDALNPYKGGNDILWRLKELDNIDKHRLLITACSTLSARTTSSNERAALLGRYEGSHPGFPPPDLRNTLYGITPPMPIKTGDKLWTVAHSEMEDQVKFHFDVAFDEPRIMQRRSVIETLHEMTKLVGQIILDFDPLLK